MGLNGQSHNISTVARRPVLDPSKGAARPIELIYAMEIAGDLKPEKLPKIWTGAELLETDFPEPDWLVPTLIPEGTTILAGAPKIGKSWLVLHLAHAISTGGFALGKYPCMPKSVLVLALEDTPRRLKSRMEIMGLEASESLHFATEVPAGTSVHQLLAAYKNSLPHLDLVIVDTLSRVPVEPKPGESRYETDYRQIASLKATAEKVGVSVIAVTHTRKMAAEDFLHTVSGSVAVTGAADTVLALSRERGNRDGVLQLTGRDVDEQTLAMKFDADMGMWEVLGDADEIQSNDERQELYDLLSESDEPMTLAEIAESTERKKPAVQRMLTRMVSEGLVSKPSRGKYQCKQRKNVNAEGYGDSDGVNTTGSNLHFHTVYTGSEADPDHSNRNQERTLQDDLEIF